MVTITPTISSPDKNATITWETLTEADTATSAQWPGGDGFVEIMGTFGGATVNVQFSSDDSTFYNVNTAAPPIGSAFTEDAIVYFSLPRGYIKPVAVSGSSQDVDIKVSPKRSI